VAAVSVRQAVAADLDALATLFDRYRQFQGQASSLAAARSFLSERFDHAESIVFIAFDGHAQELYAARGWTRDEQFFMLHRFPPSS